MHVFIGGAFNGKTTYVKNWLATKGKEGQWLTAQQLVTTTIPLSDEPLVITNIEEWVEVTKIDERQAIQRLAQVTKRHETIFILTDVGRGLVPLEREYRQLRDTCGRIYQYLLKEANEVTRIWYGIGQQIKKGETDK